MLQTELRSRTAALDSHRHIPSRRKLRLLTVLVGCIVLAGCGGDSDDGGSTNPPTSSTPPPASSPDNGTLTLNGSPSAAVMVGNNYNYVPTTSNSNGGTLEFSIANKPDWAEFNSATGRLNGTPGPGHVGTYASIVITVSDGTNTAATGSFSISVVATAVGSATLNWLPPTEREDGSPLFGELAGYKVYWGTSPSNLEYVETISNPGVTSYVVEELTPSTWFFAVTAYDTSGLESDMSNPGSKTLF